MIAHQKRRFHGLGGNFEGLHDEGGAEQSQQNGDQKRFSVLGNPTFRRSLVAVRGTVQLTVLQIAVGNIIGLRRGRFDCHEFPSGFGGARYENFQGRAGRFLLCFLLAAAFGRRQPLS